MPAQSVANGNSNGNGTTAVPAVKSRLAPADVDAVQDLLCVGFGPASLAVAIALHDALEAGTVAEPAPKVLFLDKQEAFSWHSGMLLPGARMQISFVKDLATLRDPRSPFTFINYLHSNDRLVEFTNLNTFLPAREEYEDYLRWCASFFGESVRYNSEVVAVEAERTEGSAVETFRVIAKHPKSGAQQVYRARKVLVAVGGQASLPAVLPAAHPRVVHSSQYSHRVPALLNDRSAPYRVAVVGAGQSAAEIFNNIQVLYPNSHTSLIMRSEFLKPSDDSPFVNSIFNPEYVDELFQRPAQTRKNLLDDARQTNYGVVRLGLIETLYERMYHQRRTIGRDETQWPHRILSGHRVARAETGDKDALKLFVERDSIYEPTSNGNGNGNGAAAPADELDVDLVVAATGYRRDTHVAMLKDVWPLLPETSAAQAPSGSWVVQDEGAVSAPRLLGVGRDYEVQFAPGTVAPGSGVWLQGCCEGTHGLSDTLLSVLATRSGEIVESIFGGKH